MGQSKHTGSIELNRRIEKRIGQLKRYTEKAFDITFPDIEIRYDLRGKCAGQALLGEDIIRFNRVLLEENVEHFVTQTVGHEFAHLAAFKIFGERGHGEKWKLVMQTFGLKPVRCHKYDTNNASVRSIRRFRYECNCREHLLTTIRHNRSLMGQADYLCRYCRTRLRFQSSAPSR